MGKHKKSTQNSSSTTENISEKNEEEKLDLITSRLIDLCGQKPSSQPPTTNVLWKEHLEIREQIRKLRELQKYPTETKNRSEKMDSMIDWCKRNGFRENGVSVANFDESGGENFGLRVERNFDSGELAVSVPRKLFLTLENAIQRNGDLKKIFSNDPLLTGMPNVALSFLVALEKSKGADSFWYAYLDSLPSIYETPLTFLVYNDEKLAENLRGSIAFEETLKLYKNIVRQYAYFYQMISSGSAVFSILTSTKILTKKRFVFDLYLWAAVTVMTRINFVPKTADGETKGEMIPALIPFFDMANHSDVPACTDFIGDEEGRQSAVIYASKTYQAKDQLLIFYGERKYWEFFVYNGFVLDDGHRYPNVIVKLGLSNSDRLLTLKDKALQRFEMLPSEQFVLSKYDREFPEKMRRFALIFCSTEEELEAFTKDGEMEPEKFQWSTKTIDEATRFLKTRLSLLVRSYSDEKEEAETTTSIERRRMRLIWMFIKGETESLKAAAALLETI